MRAAVVALALLAGACGGRAGERPDAVATVDGKHADAKARSGDADPQAAALAYAKCMRRNGAAVPDPDERGMFAIEPGVPAPDEEAMKKADRACKAERDALQGSRGEPDPELRDKALKMSRCMREHGIDMPDPTANEGGGTSVEIDPDEVDDPAFKRAQQICSKQVGMPEPGAPARSRT